METVRRLRAGLSNRNHVPLTWSTSSIKEDFWKIYEKRITALRGEERAEKMMRRMRSIAGKLFPLGKVFQTEDDTSLKWLSKSRLYFNPLSKVECLQTRQRVALIQLNAPGHPDCIELVVDLRQLTMNSFARYVNEMDAEELNISIWTWMAMPQRIKHVFLIPPQNMRKITFHSMLAVVKLGLSQQVARRMTVVRDIPVEKETLSEDVLEYAIDEDTVASDVEETKGVVEEEVLIESESPSPKQLRAYFSTLHPASETQDVVSYEKPKYKIETKPNKTKKPKYKKWHTLLTKLRVC